MAFEYCQCYPQPEQQKEGNEWQVLVQDHSGGDQSHDAQHRPGDDLEQLVDGVGCALAACEYGQKTLAEQGQQRHFRQGTQDAYDEYFRVGHLAPSFIKFSCRIVPMSYDHWRHYARGWLFHFFGKSEAAYEAYVAAFRVDPQDIQSARHLAAIAAQRKNYQVAEHWFLEVLRIEPDDADSHYNLGFVREQMKALRPAIESFKEAARLKPALDRAWYGMGLAHAALGEHAAAAEAFREAARLQPLNGQAWYQLGMACHHSGERGKVEEALTNLLKCDPKVARQLVKDSGRDDLARLMPEMPW